MKIDITSWKDFEVKDIFKIKRPQKRSFSKYDSGTIPFVTSGEFNNGIQGYVTPLKNDKLDLGNCISVSPVEGKALYQPEDFLGRGGGGSSIILLYNDKLNKYNGLFLATVITKKLQKHEYKDMVNGGSIAIEKLTLPCDGEQPDFLYMEDYVKKIQTKVIEKINNLSKII